MKRLFASISLLLSAVLPSASLAQGAAGQTAAVGDPQTAGRSVSNSFDALPSALKIGQEVLVRGETGRAIRGKVVSISDTQLVVSRDRAFRRAAHQTLTRNVVRRVDIVDSTWNGCVIGAVAGIGLLAGAVGLSENAPGEAGLAVGFLGLFGALGSAAAGCSIDHRLVNNPVYERSRGRLGSRSLRCWGGTLLVLRRASTSESRHRVCRQASGHGQVPQTNTQWRSGPG